MEIEERGKWQWIKRGGIEEGIIDSNYIVYISIVYFLCCNCNDDDKDDEDDTLNFLFISISKL